ncbi:glutamyl-tRNA amidotransferase [Candidatus Mycoplasma haematobovis]|uniref:Glutamyl-tRNA amidotransferase n=1 Tax=Candidatus Mycoplasma haematobovis TaxID=432608 RepID=A0A1A9QF56_9MOLU|nr:amidase family protein [Candidatus Mycoplasma haematobovis]OAL10339.1 glutamyl-tRNA amidotransferase [Candidatus Mycoplasma haematobovis]
MSSLISRTKQIFKSLAEEESNSYLSSTLNKDISLKKINNPLANTIYSLKDLISNTDGYVTGGSKFLSKYKPPFDATVYEILKKAGAINIANANLDEFGLGGTGLHAYGGEVRNPLDTTRMIGGSSAGSAYLVKKGYVDYSIASDTGDSARIPASYTGIYGFKPSYGMISRYGFFPFCSQFDTPAIIASSLETIATVFSEISVPDERDLTTLSTIKYNYIKALETPLKKPIKIAIFKNLFNSPFRVEERFKELIEKLKEKEEVQIELYEFNKELLDLCTLIYSIVSRSESISNYSNLTGLFFPFETDPKFNVINKQNGRDYSEILFNNRSVLGKEFVYRQITGMYFLNGSNYENVYLKSKKLITLINKEIEELFTKFDLVISPTSEDIAPKADEYKREYKPNTAQNILLLANFCSLPAISIPWTTLDNMPVGLHLMSAFRSDAFLLNVTKYIKEWVT